MKSSISAIGTSPSVAPPTRSFLVLLADGSRLRVTCRDLAAQLRQERNITLKRLRQARAEAKAEVADRIGEARIRSELEASERQMDAAIRRLSKQVRVRPERRRSSSPTRSSRSTLVGTGHSGVIITSSASSALARRDRLGREGIMLRIRYVRAGGKHARPGCLRRHWRYIAREAAVTLDSDGRKIVLSNMGDDIDEVADALDLQEQVLRETRKNAKLGFRMVGAFAYGLPVDARREILQRLGDELFGARDLPWSAAAHDADPAAKVDNPHFHLDYALLPMALQADGSIVICNDLRTDLDGQEGLRFIRHTVARVMTEVAREYGLDRTFTALSYRERGMDREGGEHVGQEGTAAHRRGEHVASVARNEAKQRRAEARERESRARERLDALERLKRAIVATPAAPSLTNEPADMGASAGVTSRAAPAVADAIVITDIPAIGRSPTVPSEAIAPATVTVVEARSLSDSLPPFAVFQPAPDLVSFPAAADDVPSPGVVATASPAIWDMEPAALAMPAMPPLVVVPAPAPVSAPASALPFAAMAPPAPCFDREPFSVVPVDATGPFLDAPLIADLPSSVDVPYEAAPGLPSEAVALVIASPAAAPSVNDPGADIVANFVSAPSMGAAPPKVGVFLVAPDFLAEPFAIADIGSGAPVTIALPAVAILQRPAPRMARVDLPRVDTSLAPHVAAVPMLAEAGNIVAGIAPPTVTLLGTPARYTPVAEPIIFSIGKPTPNDPADKQIEQRLKEVVEREEARRRDHDAREQRDLRAADAVAFEALRRRDEWLGQDELGRFTVSDAALRASGLSPEDLNDPDAQAQLEAIAFDQVDRLDPVLHDSSGRPALLLNGGAIRLDDRFPKKLRDDVARWSGHPHFRAFVGTMYPQLREALLLPSAVPATWRTEAGPHSDVERAVAPGGSWRRARAAREQAMAEWEAVGRLLAGADHRPGRALQSTYELPLDAREQPSRASAWSPAMLGNNFDRLR